MSDPFAPLDRVTSPKAAAKKFEVIAPVPEGSPKAPARHPKLGAPSGRWEYRDAAGALLGYVCRFDPEDGGKEFRPLTLNRPAGDGRPVWRWVSWTNPRPLYGLDRLEARPRVPALITEGEKSADAAGRLLPGHVAVTSPNGASNGQHADWTPLRGRHVVIWRDADAPGLAHAETVAALLHRAGAASVAIVTPPEGVAAGWDAADAEAEGWTQTRATALVASARAVSPTDAAPGAGPHAAEPERKRAPAQRDAVMAIIATCRLWHSPEREAFASYTVGDHIETWPIRSTTFREWLTYRALKATGDIPGAQSIEDAIRAACAQAVMEGEEIAPWMRTGMREGRLYIDLCDRAWRAVEIDGRGWRVIERHNLPFTRATAMRPLPVPNEDDECSIDELRPFVNAATEDDFRLIVGWLVGALRNRGPYGILVLNGQQGTGKSFLSRILRSLVDPNVAPIRSAPEKERDLMTAAVNAHLLVLDNLSSVPAWLADALCRIVTRGGFAIRANYTDKDEVVLDATRPIILNGIPALTDRADLGSRTLTVRLAPISEEARQTEDEIEALWEAAQPRVLAALFTALSAAVRNIGRTRLPGLPRLADLTEWVTAAAPGLGWEPGEFVGLITTAAREAANSAFEASPVAIAIKGLAVDKKLWSGTATDLLPLLRDRVDPAILKLRIWPETNQALGNAIDRVIPLLKGQGVTVERRHSGKRTITIALAAGAE